MSEQKIFPCRICGEEAIIRESASPSGFYANIYCRHHTCGPIMSTREEAIEEWNLMMQPQVFAEVESTGTSSYRDRVDSMVAALWDRHEPTIIKRAISLVDAIDGELAKRGGVE